jgi:putative transcriptional regulator
MTISSHPDIATLMTCSAGSTPEALCAVVTSHLSMCPECMDELTSMESIGVALFEELHPVETVSDHCELTLIPAAERAAYRAAQTRREGDIPGPLIEVIGNNLEALDWQILAPGIWNFTVPLTQQAKGDLRLIKLEPGSSLPEHSHPGEELILVLRGSYRDAVGTYGPGDFADLDEDDKHSIVAHQDGCILLVGNEAVPAFLTELV